MDVLWVYGCAVDSLTVLVWELLWVMLCQPGLCRFPSEAHSGSLGQTLHGLWWGLEGPWTCLCCS